MHIIHADAQTFHDASTMWSDWTRSKGLEQEDDQPMDALQLQLTNTILDTGPRGWRQGRAGGDQASI
jgi:hypothetical protein